MNDNNKRGFKRKTIEQTIKHKIAGWLKTINDEDLRRDVKSHYILTGGAIASMLQGDLPNDYDIYFDDSSVAARLAKYYLKQLVGEKYSDFADVIESEDRVEVKIFDKGVLDKFDAVEGTENKGRYRVSMITSNAITLTNEIQLVLRFVGDASQIHKNYDFVHATNYFSQNTDLVLHPAALESILSKELKYVGSLYPVCSLFRIKKFIKRGWNITAGEMFKIIYDASQLDLQNYEVLEDQLTGVDTSYFARMIELLRMDGRPLERGYLFEVINKVFDEAREDEAIEEETETEKQKIASI